MLHLSGVVVDGGVAREHGRVAHLSQLEGTEHAEEHECAELEVVALVSEHALVEHEVRTEEDHECLRVGHHWVLRHPDQSALVVYLHHYY